MIRQLTLRQQLLASVSLRPAAVAREIFRHQVAEDGRRMLLASGADPMKVARLSEDQRIESAIIFSGVTEGAAEIRASKPVAKLLRLSNPKRGK